jgi:hypothetical protein
MDGSATAMAGRLARVYDLHLGLFIRLVRQLIIQSGNFRGTSDRTHFDLFYLFWYNILRKQFGC